MRPLLSQEERYEKLIKSVQKASGINVDDPEVVYEPEKIAKELVRLTLNHTNIMRSHKLMQESDLYN